MMLFLYLSHAVAETPLALQILLCLSCYWSVHMLCWLTCTPVRTHAEATVAKVVPTPNNGSSELVRMNVRGPDACWFNFQKLKYVWDGERKVFRGLQFPTDHSFAHYLEWKGYEEEEALNKIEGDFGNNK